MQLPDVSLILISCWIHKEFIWYGDNSNITTEYNRSYKSGRPDVSLTCIIIAFPDRRDPDAQADVSWLCVWQTNVSLLFILPSKCFSQYVIFASNWMDSPWL